MTSPSDPYELQSWRFLTKLGLLKILTEFQIFGKDFNISKFYSEKNE
jgi:hypothetical protein